MAGWVIKKKRVTGTLRNGPQGTSYFAEFDLGDDGPFDLKLRDKIAVVGYTDPEDVLAAFGEKAARKIWEDGEELRVTHDVTYWDWEAA